MGWRVVYIEECDRLSLYLDNIKIIGDNTELLIPISDVHTLIVDNYKMVFTVQLIIKLAKNNVNVVFNDLEHKPCSQVVSISGNYNAAYVLRQQIEWSEDQKSLLHKLIVQAKIANQVAILEKNERDLNVINRLQRYQDEVELSDIYNREGLAAKAYFRELFGPSFIRFNDDAINAGLDYGYSILRSQISTIIVSKGYHPSLGIFHKGPQNAFNFADDIIEVFRPIVDDYVYNNIEMLEIFTKKHREALIKLTTKKVMFNNQKQTILNSMLLFIESVVNCFENGTQEFKYPSAIVFENDL